MHKGYSKLDIFEGAGSVAKINTTQLYASKTAILLPWATSGGYRNHIYIQAL